MTICSRYIECWITKVTDTHSEYVILIAFPLQQWLYERAWMLCYTQIDCLLSLKFFCHSVQKNAPCVHSRTRKIIPCYTAQFSVSHNQVWHSIILSFAHTVYLYVLYGSQNKQLLFPYTALTLNLLTTTIVAPPSNASKWQMGFNSAFKGLTDWFLKQWFKLL